MNFHPIPRTPIFAFLFLVAPWAARADVERYKSEAAYLARLAELDCVPLTEDFEAAAWGVARSDYPNNHFVPSITYQRITWASAGRDLWTWPGTAALISTNQNWGRGGSWGIFDNYLASTKRITAPEPIYGIGVWVNTNPDLTDVGILFEDRTSANEPGYMVSGYGAMYPGDIHPVGHTFIGFIDPDGFTGVILTGTLEVDEDGVLEGATVFGADDFTFAVLPSFVPSPREVWRQQHFTADELGGPALEETLWGTAVDPDGDGLNNDAEFALGTNPRDASDGDGGATVSLDAGLLVIQFTRRNDVVDLTVDAELSHDLIGWDAEAFEEITVIDRGDGYESVTLRQLSSAHPTPRAFANLKITQP